MPPCTAATRRAGGGAWRAGQNAYASEAHDDDSGPRRERGARARARSRARAATIPATRRRQRTSRTSARTRRRTRRAAAAANRSSSMPSCSSGTPSAALERTNSRQRERCGRDERHDAHVAAPRGKRRDHAANANASASTIAGAEVEDRRSGADQRARRLAEPRETERRRTRARSRIRRAPQRAAARQLQAKTKPAHANGASHHHVVRGKARCSAERAHQRDGRAANGRGGDERCVGS